MMEYDSVFDLFQHSESVVDWKRAVRITGLYWEKMTAIKVRKCSFRRY
jgi:hypothetical protein